MNLSERLKRAIKIGFKTQKIFGEKVELSLQSVNDYCSGRNRPGSDILEKFYKAGISVDWLISGDGSMFADNEQGRLLKKNFANEKKFVLLPEEIKQLIEETVQKTLEKNHK